MMSRSNAALAASPYVLAAVGVLLWTVLSSGCSGAPAPGLSGSAERHPEAGPGDPTYDAGLDAASTAVGPSGPAYDGMAIVEQVSDASGSIASADGRCPIPDGLGNYGLNCPSCAQSHCASAISECDPTMVNACTEYYCPTQCVQLGDGGSGGNACAKVVQCCPTLVGTPLGLQCILYQAGSASSACQALLTQAQAIGRCV